MRGIYIPTTLSLAPNHTQAEEGGANFKDLSDVSLAQLKETISKYQAVVTMNKENEEMLESLHKGLLLS